MDTVNNEERLQQSMRIKKLREELGALTRHSHQLKEMEEELRTKANQPLAGKLMAETWLPIKGELETKSQLTPQQI